MVLTGQHYVPFRLHIILKVTDPFTYRTTNLFICPESSWYNTLLSSAGLWPKYLDSQFISGYLTNTAVHYFWVSFIHMASNIRPALMFWCDWLIVWHMTWMCMSCVVVWNQCLVQISPGLWWIFWGLKFKPKKLWIITMFPTYHIFS